MHWHVRAVVFRAAYTCVVSVRVCAGLGTCLVTSLGSASGGDRIVRVGVVPCSYVFGPML